MDAEAKLNCRAAARLLLLAAERPLDAGELNALSHHLDACFLCKNFSLQLDFLHRASVFYAAGQ